MQHEAGMLCQPTLYRRSLVGGGVVQDQVDIEVGGDFGVDLAQERQELGGPVTRVQSTDHLSGGQIQGGVQA